MQEVRNINDIFMWGRNFGAVTNMVKADVHKHWMIQLFVGNGENLEINVNDQKIHCRAIVVNMNTKHMFYSGNLIHFTMLINPTTQLGRTMRVHFSNEKPYYILCEDIAVELQKQLINAISMGKNTDYSEIIRNVVYCFKNDNLNGYDERIEIILRRIDTCDCEEEKHQVKQIAKEMAISESRLSHLFKEETGIPLKSYIVLHKLLRAYEKILDGESITAAAITAGFDSAAHLAFTNKKMTGMSARGIMKESRFLKVIL
ncbi:AraC family transcriptional regulator [Clostridium combesii]|uniref:AraC family transcriptional regulator n=2 Tax=Clostridium combesii TaxID=39481 RepID=A0A2G7HJR4_9CLOT|nr:AraC family transcriptional regulator [Clostridium combesii]